MAITHSSMVELGSKAPDFTLKNVRTGDSQSLLDLKSDAATVVMFICNHCPFVQHILKRLVEAANSYQAKGVSFIAISSNDIKNYPEDGPERMKELVEVFKVPFPYLYDESQEVAKAYHAACTPDFFVYNGNQECVYRGRFDESTPGNGKPVTGSELIAALDGILEGTGVLPEQHPSMGCNIKWKEE